MSNYKKPDVFVNIKLGNVSPNIAVPELEAVIIGEHYYVANKNVSETQYYDGTEISNMKYPGIPKQSVDTDEELLVDVGNADFAPRIYIRTEDGVDVEITNATGVSVAAVDIDTIPGSLKYNKTTGQWAATGDALTGQVVVSFRALEEKYTGDNIRELSISSLTDLITVFGDNGYSYANPLGFGMYMALLKGQTTIKGVAVGNPPNSDASSSYTGVIADELAAHTYTADFLSTIEVYCIVPLTFTPIVRDFWISHVKSQSLPENKHERFVLLADAVDAKNVYFAKNGEVCGEFTSSATGSGWAVGDKITVGGNDYYVRLVDGATAYVALPNGLAGSGITFQLNDGADVTDGAYAVPTTGVVIYADGVNFQSPGFNRAKVGDAIAFKTDKSVTGAIAAGGVGVSTLKTGALTGGTPDFGTTGRYELFRYATLDGTSTGAPDKEAESIRLRDLGNSIKSTRVEVFAPGYVSFPISGVDTDIPSYFAACQMAGEFAATIPGFVVGVTPLVGITESKSKKFKSSRYFSEKQLDEAACGGITFLVNDRPGFNVYPRHTLTTDMSSIESQEVMMQFARDSIAKTYRETLRTIIRRFRIGDDVNVTLPAMLDGIRTSKLNRGEAQEILHDEVSVPEGSPDTVNVKLRITHFYPLNHINVDGTVETPESVVIVAP